MYSSCVGCDIVQADHAPEAGVAQGIFHGILVRHQGRHQEEVAVLGQALTLAFPGRAPLRGFVVRLRSLHAAAVLRAPQLSSFLFRCRG